MERPETQFEEDIVRPSVDIATKREQVRSRMTAIRSALAHIERSLSRQGITAEELDAAIAMMTTSEEFAFKARYALQV